MGSSATTVGRLSWALVILAIASPILVPIWAILLARGIGDQNQDGAEPALSAA